MNYLEFLKKANTDFNVDLHIEKEKAGYLMLISKDRTVCGTLHGPECGYGCPSRIFAFELNGWGYALINDTWFRMRDGCIGWRHLDEPAFGVGLPDDPEVNRNYF